MEKSTRYSKKREAILEVIRSTDHHPSAEWVYQTLKPENPDLSLGTVYRNLAFFQERGMVQSVGVIRGQERFDGNTDPHPHFICTACGGVTDLGRLEFYRELDDMVNRTYDCEVERQELNFYGKCRHCASKESISKN